jgi:hypothetical protein
MYQRSKAPRASEPPDAGRFPVMFYTGTLAGFIVYAATMNPFC